MAAVSSGADDEVRSHRAKRIGTRFRSRGGVTTLLLVGAIVAAPLLVLILRSFNVADPGLPAEFGLDNWRAAFSSSRTMGALRNSFALSLARGGIALPTSIALAWLIARTDTPGRGALELACWIGVFLPVLPRVFGWILLLDPNFGIVNNWLSATFNMQGPFNIYSFWGIVWVHIASTTVYIQVVLLVPAFRSIAASMEEAAHVCGASASWTLRHVTLPLVAPAALGIAILAFIRALEGFEVELLLGSPVGLDVYSTRIYNIIRQFDPEYGQATALGSIFVLVLAILSYLYQRYMRTRQFSSVTGKGFNTRVQTLGRWRWPVAILCGMFFVVALGLPMVLLVLGSFMRRYGFFSIDDPFTYDHWLQVLQDPVLTDSLINSLTMASIVAFVAVALYSVVAYIAARGQSMWHRIGEGLLWIPWAIPGVLLSLGMLWILLESPLIFLYGTMGALVLALLIKESPLATMLLKSGIRQLSPELEEAALTSGASRGTSFARIVVPLIAPTAMTVAVYVFLSALTDLGTVVLLYSGDSRPLAILMLEYSVTGYMEAGTVVGVIITLIVLVVVVVVRLLGLRLSRTN